jgi:hypothetical protein
MKRFAIVHAVALLALLALAGLAVQAAAEEAAVSPATEGWVERAFEFSAPDLDFKTLVPEAADVASVPMKPREGDTLGSIKIIGEVPVIDAAQIPLRVTILGYDLRTSGGADRICSRVQTQEGYKQVEVDVSPHRSEAMSLAFTYEGDLAVDGIISRCLTRGRQALAVNFLFQMPKHKTEAERDAIFDFANQYAGTFTGNMVFKNGENGGYWDGMKSVPLSIEGKTLDVLIPDDWQVPINDFDGRPTAELHVLKQDEGVSKGGVWLLAADMRDKPDLEKVGSTLIPFFLKIQFQALEAPKLEDSSIGPDLSGKGTLMQHFLFSLSDKEGNDYGDARALMVWHQGRVYTLIRWSSFEEDGSQNAFFSMLPVLNIYDAFAATIHKLLTDEG